MKRTIPVCILIRTEDVLTSNTSLFVSEMDLSGDTFTLVAESELTIELTPQQIKDVTKKQIEYLKQKKSKALAAAEAMVNQIDGQINTLQAIEHKLDT